MEKVRGTARSLPDRRPKLQPRVWSVPGGGDDFTSLSRLNLKGNDLFDTPLEHYINFTYRSILIAVMSGRNRGRQNTNQDDAEEKRLWKEIKSQAAVVDEKFVRIS